MRVFDAYHCRYFIPVLMTLLVFLAQACPANSDQKPERSKPPIANSIDSELKSALATAPTILQWPNSSYATLLDIGNVLIKSDGTVVAKYRLTYKLFNERARRLAEVNLPFNSSYQEIRVISARTIKKDGTIIDVKPEDMRKGSSFSEYLMYDDAQGVGFSMPAIEDNCIIDYTWEEITRPLLMPGQFWTYWGFTGLEPVGLSRYVLKTPAEKKLSIKVYNDPTLNPKVVTSLDGKFKTYTWERSNQSPIEPEYKMPRLNDVRIWMEVSSIDSWQDVAKWYWNLQLPQAKASSKIKSTVAELISGKVTGEEKARAIYDWVANRTRYVGLEFGLSAFRPHPAAEVHDKLYGDCKDKATLLITMLGLAGIKAQPVLLHADERRIVNSGLPTLNAFNHCIAIASVDGKDVWLDATAETCAYGDIPYGDRGVQAFVVGEGKGEFRTIPMYQPEQNGASIHYTITLKPDGSADAQSEMNFVGEAGQALRYGVRSMTPDQRKQMMQKIAAQFSSGTSLKDFSLPNGVDKAGSFLIKYTASAPQFADSTKTLMLIPVGPASAGENVNPFPQDKRTLPIVEEDTSQTRKEFTINLPDGYAIEDMPGDVSLSSPITELKRTVTKSSDGKTINIVYIMKEHPGKVSSEDYISVQKYYREFIKLDKDRIVLKKAN